MKLWSLLLAAVLVVASIPDAEAARRLGGGGSVGRQSSNVTQRQSTPPAAPNAAPTAAQAQKPAQAPAATPQPAPGRPWGAMLGGLAAGLGLAWLANSLGMGAGFANILMFALLGLVLFAVIGAIMRARRGQQAGAGAAPGGLAYQGAGAPAEAPATRQYNPDKVGNDASARPWERNSMAFESAKYAPGGGLKIGSGLEGAQSWGIPAGFDTGGFLEAAKRNFATLQDAWDRSDISTLRSMMTDEMLTEIRSQLAQREQEAPGTPVARTEVAMLEANLLGIEETVDDWLASVEFSGMIREDAATGPVPFREVWNMVKSRNGAGGWLVAGVQALQ